jgi:AcrR family transcriptional regulator
MTTSAANLRSVGEGGEGAVRKRVRKDPASRRAELVRAAREVFGRSGYAETGITEIAHEAQVSKALLYHYFPGKQAYFAATLEEKAAELSALTEPDPSLPPVEQLTGSLGAFLGWVEANREAYGKLVRSAAAIPEVREVVDRVRDATSARILEGIAPHGAAPALRTAVRAWLWFMDGAILDWVEHGDLEREQLQGLLLGTLMGAVMASGEGGALAPD